MLADSNILVYALNKKSENHLIASRFLQKHSKGLYITQQNILETLRVITHHKYPNPFLPDEAISDIEKIVVHLNMISPNFDTYFRAIELIKLHKLTGNRIFDAYLAATMLSNGITRIATDNERDFKIYKGIEVYNPFSV